MHRFQVSRPPTSCAPRPHVSNLSLSLSYSDRHPAHVKISVFGAICIVFAIFGVHQGIFSSARSLNAMGAGWLILAMVDVSTYRLSGAARR